MKKLEKLTKSRTRRTVMTLAATLVALSCIAASPTVAGHKHKHKHKDKHHHHHHVTLKRPVYYDPTVQPPARIVRVPRRVAVPRVIRTGHVETYRPYYGGRVYYGPHRHDHDVYYFPVRHARGYTYEPHYYCRGHRVTVSHVAYHGPNVSFRIAF